MADRYPLIYNSSANQIQELQSGDNLDIGNASIVGISTIVGVLTATSFSGDGSGLRNLPAASTPTLDAVTGAGNVTTNNISVGIATATSFVKSGGTSSEFLKADGSVDSSTYLTSFTETFTAVGIQSGGVSIGNATTLNFIGAGNTFAVNGSTIDVSIQGSAGGSSGGGALDITSCLFI